mmetsp:Transcript_200/g.226  ORF Transcript_200/g.226 Transcript_200/m.226 type:complete len:257 (+) Transcript_200:68-838(+)|eukprot:CAMPEP_0114359860 /NCGR_PEP_ID=MMETSP0101-20121206/23344_1 /TAXON_ID=38822 ORGANISM="Pteridomonas danica, Strain PT" /NCGR_SAMPLE_ID=MMETSP0101 /ASSEMBLY_ACC=CAM_ASM_000211 /LENGTH=256 /DNA_ID=CAMNT_0001503635 /DNA_START=16 /DNA_END=786 /DNA_ORIENTATION=+
MACFGAQDVKPVREEVCLKAAFAKSYTETSLVKDLPRLASRVSINSSSLSLPAACLMTESTEATPDDNSEPNSKRSTVGKVIVALTHILLGEEAAKDTTAVDHYDSQISSGIDPQPACLDLLETLGGEDSIVVRSLKLVNQGVVLYSLGCLRSLVPTGTELLTKDVRGPNGWLIEIDIFESFRIKHVRKEQSLDLWGDATNHFEFEFEISATIDRDLQDVHATWLRVNEVTLAETMEDARRQELYNALGNGGRIIS